MRGCERRIYYVKNTESDIFDEAYLVLRRREACGTGVLKPDDIRLEAMRIIEDAGGVRTCVRRERGSRLLPFFAGVGTAGVISALLAVIIFIW